MTKKQPQKSNFDKTIKKVEGLSNKVDIIMRNRLIIAFFLIVDGITFLLNPDTTLNGMAQNIILILILAAASVLISNLAAKVKDVRTIVITLIIIILAIIFYFFPDLIASYIQLLLALFIIYDGLVNLANALHLDWMSRFTAAVANTYNKVTTRKPKSKEKQAKREKFKEIDTNINTSLEEQGAKMMDPLKNFVNKSSKSSILYIFTNSATVILGIVLLVYPGASMMIWGLIFLYTGFSNLLNGMRSMNLSRMLKEKKFKEILFDADKTTKTEKTNTKTTKPKSITT